MKRIAIAGFQHETNTFGLTKTGLHEFKIADSWPGMLTGADVLSGTAGINLPIAGFVEAAGRHPDIELIPILWCAAEPSAHVTDEAFESITDTILDGLRKAGPLDGVYLDLHGAMVTESHDDGEGEMLRRVRALLGNDTPVVVSLDLHANITAAMVTHATSIAVFRTYPHLDMAETGGRCLGYLMAHTGGFRPAKAFRQLPFLIPLHTQYTGAAPCRDFYDLVRDQENDAEAWAELALGFTAADIPDAGPSVLAYAPSQAEADRIASEIYDAVLKAETAFECRMLTPEDAVKAALANRSDKPVVIADVQDNPGAGATSDTTGLLTALVASKARGALLGLLHDPGIAAAAHAAGTEAIINGDLGGKSGVPGDKPYTGCFRVAALSDGICAFTGAMYGGGTAMLGPSAVLDVIEKETDIRVVVTSMRSQCLDLGLFTHFGLKPEAAKIIVVKSTVHFRADFEPVAADILVSAAPGVFHCALESIPYRHLRTGIRLGPGGPVFAV